MLEHQHLVAAGDGDGAAGAALAHHHGDIGHAERQRHVDRAGDRLRLAALLGVYARKGAESIHQRDDRQAESVGELHEPGGLAIALRPRHAEIMLQPALRVGALLLADEADRLAAKPREAADDRRILAEGAVAGERRELAEQQPHIVGEMRPLRMARDLDFLPSA